MTLSHLPQGLYVLNSVANLPPSNQSVDPNAFLYRLIAGFPWVSLGAPDSCGYLPDYHYCQMDAVGIYVR